MRPWGRALVVALLLIPGLTATADSESVRDDFKAVSFAGSDGSLPWAGPWTESGESDGPTEGQIRVGPTNCSNNKCLELSGGLLGEIAIRRGADIAALSGPTLEFDMYVAADLLSTGTFRVQARGKGSDWVTLASYTLLVETGPSSESIDVTAFAGADFELRFHLDSLLGGDHVYVDRVVVEGAVQGTTSTTSSSTSSTTTSTTAGKQTSTTSSSTTTTAAESGTSEKNDEPSTDDEETTTTTSHSSTEDDGDVTTTSTDPATTTTTSGGLLVAPISGGPSTGDGLRTPAFGLLADYRPGMMSGPDLENVEVLGAELDADFSLAVEVFETIKVWIAVLALIITAAIVSGMDERRTRDQKS